ncbi:MAG: nucleotide exchange factor GrpE [Coriobacteriia bacterium]|nr:nucleotide exchange factor GrpE [Coriobacteriia bacterium]
MNKEEKAIIDEVSDTASQVVDDARETSSAIAEDVAGVASAVEKDVAEAASSIKKDVAEAASIKTEDVDAGVSEIKDDIEAAVPGVEEELKAEVEHWKDYARRAQAEFENTRKRLEARSQDEIKRAGSRVITSIIPIVDDIELAMAHAGETDNEMKDGLVAIHTKLMGALEREGVDVIDPVGQAFDSEVAQAVSVRESDDVADDTVLEVIQKGYRLGGKTLRPAMVVVSKGA